MVQDLHGHYKQLLGLSDPWTIKSVDVSIKPSEVHIDIVHPKGIMVVCPDCGIDTSIYDYRSSRTWRHLDTMQFKTFITCDTPRSNCKDCGIKTIKVPWAAKNSGFTLLFEYFAISVIECANTTLSAAKLLRLNWHQVQIIMARAVERGLERRDENGTIKYLGIDEKSFLKKHVYVTNLYDLDASRVLNVVQDRKKDSSITVLKTIKKEKRADIIAVAMDMWKAYMFATAEVFPQADIVHDKYHISSYLTKAVDATRKAEHSILLKSGENHLTKTKYLWLKNKQNWTKKEKMKFKELRSMTLKVSRAWAIKEAFQQFWQYSYLSSAKKFFKKWFFWATHSKIKPIIKTAKMLKKHLQGLLAYISHRITNAVAEGLNSKIQNIKANARGFRNFNNYRTSILFFCGKLEYYPQ